MYSGRELHVVCRDLADMVTATSSLIFYVGQSGLRSRTLPRLSFIHRPPRHHFETLSRNIFEKRYDLTEHEASDQASFLLAGSVFLYPIVRVIILHAVNRDQHALHHKCGYIIDRLKHRPILHQLFLLSSTLTMLCYLWLAIPPSFTGTPLPSVALYGIGQGFAPCESEMNASANCHS